MDTNDMESLYHVLEWVYHSSESSHTVTADDEEFRGKTKGQIAKRDEEYTSLLEHFVWITKGRNILREVFKWLFLIFIIVCAVVFLFMVYSLFEFYINKATVQEVMEASPVLITSLVGFVSVIVSVPITITKYLFSTKEDEYITKIILHTQKHDTSGREWSSRAKGDSGNSSSQESACAASAEYEFDEEQSGSE